jgi:hypothetical protein
VTFRLADSLPKEAALRLRVAAQPESLRDEFLDRGWGACWLRDERVAEIVEQAFLAFDGERYRMHAWTIMPNRSTIVAATGRSSSGSTRRHSGTTDAIEGVPTNVQGVGIGRRTRPPI